MLQHKMPLDTILSSGELHSLKEFVELCAKKIGIKNWRQYVKVDKSIVQRKIAGQLLGNSSLAQRKLHWTPTVNLEQLISIMIDNDKL